MNKKNNFLCKKNYFFRLNLIDYTKQQKLNFYDHLKRRKNLTKNY